MTLAQGDPELRDNARDLQGEALTAMTTFLALAAFLWLTWITFGLRVTYPAGGWLALGLLAAGAGGSYRLRERSLPAAMHLLVWGTLACTLCLGYTFPSPATTCLLAAPVALASALFGERAHLLTAAAASGLALAIGLAPTQPLRGAGSAVLPVIVIAAVTASTRASARSLYTAQAWAWQGYRRARHNEQMARERQAELGRALKALDEATYRLERANYMLMGARDQAEEARRLKQRFAQTISHELRTPLNLIVGFAELMSNSPEYYGSQLPPAYLRDLRILHRNACHLQTLVNDVLDLARIEAARMGVAMEEIDPGTLVQEAVNTGRSLVEARGLTLHIDVEPGLPVLQGDPVRIRQVLFNLLNNAARFTDRGGVTVSVRRQGEEVLFAVADTGVGIPAEDLPRIFEEFQQVDSGLRRRHGGAGLGLAISRGFVELHGGRIWAESQVGQGSTFYFALPTSAGTPAPALGRPAERPAPAVPEGEEPVLLAVTRSPSAAALLARHLRGCRTVVVQDLEQARHSAQQLLPQAIVIDRACEALGQGELERLALAWGLPRTLFVVCPLPGEEPLRQRLQVQGYLVKPITRESLWDVLRGLGEDVSKVLVVDDDRDFVLLMGRLLDEPLRRYEMISAYSGQEALDMVRLVPPDLILLDLGLPDTGGLEVIERIRAERAWEQIPIVVISGQDEMDDLEVLRGAMSIARAGGLLTAEVVEWLQGLLETTTRRRRSPDEGGMRRA